MFCALGWRSLFLDATGSFNTGVGIGAFALNNADSNTAVGAAALLLNDSGVRNTAIGSNALITTPPAAATRPPELVRSLPTSTDSTIRPSGVRALEFNTSGSGNTAIGNLALNSNETTNGHVTLGRNAGSGVTTVDNNVIIGHHSGVHSRFGQVNDSCYIGNIYGAGVDNLGGVARFLYVDPDGKLGTVLVAVDAEMPQVPKSVQPQAIPDHGAPQAMLNRKVEKLQAVVAEQQK